MMRIAVGSICHETSTFTPVPATWDRFYARGDEVLSTFTGTNTPVGGFIEASQDFELVPLLCAEAHPAGPLSREDFDAALDELIQRLRDALPLDGVLLYLHGSMVAGLGTQQIDDPEGHILEAVRQVIGPKVPLLVTLDIHSNVSPQMVRLADALVVRETYPEVDMAERGRECVDILRRMLYDGLKPTMAFYPLPLIWGMNQVTAHVPMRDAIDYLHDIESRPGVVTASISVGYFLADVPDMGSSIIVVTDQNLEQAQNYAEELAAWVWNRREDWYFELPSAREALALAEQAGQYPVILADMRDNPGGGSPGDSTGILRTFLEADLQDACVLYIVDPEAARICHDAGVGAQVSLLVGAKASPLQGEPVAMDAEVIALSEAGEFDYDGPMFAGLHGRMGLSAHIRQGGVHVLLVSVREQPFDTAFARSMLLDPQQMQYIAVKSTAHFRAAFEPWAGVIYVVAEPSVHDFGNLPFHRLGRKLYPFDSTAEFNNPTGVLPA
ncbi:MAG: hypothetical protein CL610_08010 [Anaerolineaceae bacterium]|nr:hypothetical protein [Anaerolineaceae bacterium]